MRHAPWIALIVLAATMVGMESRTGPTAHGQAAGDPPASAKADAPERFVTVWLRGDVSGLAYSDRVPALELLISRRGELVSRDEHWVVLRSEGDELWFPRESIAMLEVASKQ